MIHRCRTRADFERVQREGVRSAGRHLWMRSVLDSNVEIPRVAFAIGRRHGNAVTRNRLRRRLRAALDDARVVVPPGLHLLGWKRTPSPEPRFTAIVDDLAALFERAVQRDTHERDGH